MSLNRHPELWQSLLAKLQHDLERRVDFTSLQKEIETLTRKIKMGSLVEDSQQYRTRRQELYEQRRQLTVTELKKWRKLQPRKLTSPTALETCLEDH